MNKDFFDYFPEDKVKYWTDNLLTIDGITPEELSNFKQYKNRISSSRNTQFKSFDEAYNKLIAFIDNRFDYPESNYKYLKLSPDTKNKDNAEYLKLSSKMAELVHTFLERYNNVLVQGNSNEILPNKSSDEKDERIFKIINEDTIDFNGITLKKWHYKSKAKKTYFDFLYKLLEKHPDGCTNLKCSSIFGTQVTIKQLINSLATNKNGLWHQLETPNLHPYAMRKTKVIEITSYGNVNFRNLKN